MEKLELNETIQSLDMHPAVKKMLTKQTREDRKLRKRKSSHNSNRLIELNLIRSSSTNSRDCLRRNSSMSQKKSLSNSDSTQNYKIKRKCSTIYISSEEILNAKLEYNKNCIDSLLGNKRCKEDSDDESM